MSEDTPRFSIVDLLADHKGLVRQAAVLLIEGFKNHWPDDAWPDMEAALEEVREPFGGEDQPGSPR